MALVSCEQDTQREPARTTVCAGKEYLFEIGWHRVFVSFIHPVFGRTVLGIAIVVDVEGRDKLYTVLIERQCMAEVPDGTIPTAEWQIFGNHSDGFNGVPRGDLRKGINQLTRQ